METRKHAVIIRMKYPPEYPKLEWRLRFFEENVLPCFLKQSCLDFDLWVIADERYADRVRQMSPKINVLTLGGFMETVDEIMRVPCGSAESLPYNYHIQTRHDCDDLVTKDYIKRIQDECSKWTKDVPLLISFQPLKYELNTGVTYKMALQYCIHHWCSMFASLYQPGKPSGYIYEAAHRKRLPAIYHDMVHIPEGYCYMVCHDDNVNNMIKAVDTVADDQYRVTKLTKDKREAA